MILEKHFVFMPDTGIQAKNFDDIKTYIQTKITHFQDYHNWTSKNEHISLYQEILDMVAEDILAPDVDTSPISHLLYFDKLDIDKCIKYYDVVYILGTIAYNVFDYDKNALNHTEDGQHGAINLADMVYRGYKDLVAIKKINGYAAYEPILIFTTVIEAELKRKFKKIIIDELVAAVELKIQNGTYVPSIEDTTLIDCLKGNRTDHNSIYVLTEGADSLFKQANVYDPHRISEQENLILNKTTLNQLLRSNIFATKAESSFLQIMQLLFGTNDLNLRNNIAHGGFTYQNYHHTSVAGLLYLLLVAVTNDFWI